MLYGEFLAMVRMRGEYPNSLLFRWSRRADAFVLLIGGAV